MPQEIIGRFAAEHFTLNSISDPRRKQVTVALERLATWLGRPLEEATDNDLRDWLVHLRQRGLAASTVGWYLKMVLPFYRWCWQRRLIDADQLMRIRDVAPPRGHSDHRPNPYSGKELARMWAELDERFPHTTPLRLQRWHNGTSPFRGPIRRHAMRLQLDAIIELGLVCGLRRREIYHLSIDDVHWDNKYIVVAGKRVNQNPRLRDVPYPDSTRVAIEAWFRMRASLEPQPGLPLWLSVTGPVPAAALSWDRMANILHSFGDDWTLHRLRHTCATERLRAGMQLELLQQFLGHARIEQTLKYAELVRDDVHRSSERTDAEFQRAIRRRAA